MKELLDLRTLMFISGITSILACFCMLYVNFTQRTYAGFRQWTIAFSAMAAGMILLSLRNILPDFITIIIANLSLALFTMFITHGLSEFAGMKQRNWLYVLSLVIFFAVFVYFSYFQPDVSLRVIAFSTFVVIWYVCSLVIVLRDVPRVLPGKALFLISYFIFNAVWFFLRIIYMMADKHILNDLMSGGIFEKATMIVSVEVSVMCAVGLITINAQRVSYELSLAYDEIKTLEGFIPICASCKKIRDDKGFWNQLEKYISEHTDATFSHSICPECAEKFYSNQTKRESNGKGKQS